MTSPQDPEEAVLKGAVVQPTLIAIGGGGATHGTHPELDQFCLNLLPQRPRIGHVGTASHHDPEKFRRLSRAFHPRAGSVTDLPKDCSRQEAEAWVAGLDLVYVGGGDPVHLVRRWSAIGLQDTLFAAARHGTVLAGVSAGAMCWFDSFLWRSPDHGLQLAGGFGLVPGVMTPHSLAEPDRLAHLAGLVSAGTISGALAIDDGAAVILRGGVASAVFPGRGPPCAHRISRGPDGEARQAELRPRGDS